MHPARITGPVQETEMQTKWKSRAAHKSARSLATGGRKGLEGDAFPTPEFPRSREPLSREAPGSEGHPLLCSTGTNPRAHTIPLIACDASGPRAGQMGLITCHL